MTDAKQTRYLIRTVNVALYDKYGHSFVSVPTKNVHISLIAPQFCYPFISDITV